MGKTRDDIRGFCGKGKVIIGAGHPKGLMYLIAALDERRKRVEAEQPKPVKEDS